MRLPSESLQIVPSYSRWEWVSAEKSLDTAAEMNQVGKDCRSRTELIGKNGTGRFRTAAVAGFDNGYVSIVADEGGMIWFPMQPRLYGPSAPGDFFWRSAVEGVANRREYES
jgi:hypothetical protein